MLRLIKNSLICLLLVLAAPWASAFSLLGPFAAWQNAQLLYTQGEIGGPMNLGEEYRWNLRTVYYGFDESFLNYFGSNGVAAIDAAFKILNDLPAVSSMSSNLTEFPLNTSRFNYRASALTLLDLKSITLTTLLEEMGLASSENFVWTLRDHRHINPGNIPQFLIIQRNFDTITWEPSSYVNGTLYTYGILHSDTPDQADAVETPVDPLAASFTTVANTYTINFGRYFTGLTRDDAGGLRYLLRSSNLNVENVVSNGVSGPSNGSGTNSFPWVPIGVTNALGTNATTNLTNFIATALRPGVEKVTFVKVQYDSILGQNLTPITNSWTETIYTNRLTGRPTQQRLERVVTAPDIIFRAADLGVDATAGVPIGMTRNSTWANFDGLNGSAALDGPGIIQPGIAITFSKLGAAYINQSPNFVGEANQILANFLWGSFDGTTNEPIVYPSGTSIRALESAVLGR